MDAMIFAAGLGTRLQPLTLELPKALVEVGGVPMLERVARRLVAAGADRLVINTHPFPERIVEFVRERAAFGVEVRFSHEPDEPLDTGGGLRQAAPLFRREAPFFLHNCDVLSDIDLAALYTAHTSDDAALVTLATLPPGAQRYLIFDDLGLCGYAPRGGGADVLVRAPDGTPRRREFAGIHVVAPRLLELLPPAHTFSIVSLYLTLAARGERIAVYEQDHARWIDIGSPDKLARAHRMAQQIAPASSTYT
jgi:NDP-sugar pyrophosphorylase family protein